MKGFTHFRLLLRMAVFCYKNAVRDTKRDTMAFVNNKSSKISATDRQESTKARIGVRRQELAEAAAGKFR
jgi:hypothetical protein